MTLTRTDLRPYQERAAQFVIDTPKCALWVDMRMGKTISTLTAIQYLTDCCEVVSVLIVVPHLVLTNRVWEKEAEKWEHINLTFSRAHGNMAQRQRAIDAHKAGDTDILIVGYPNLLRVLGQLSKFCMIVIDEASAFKNVSTKRYNATKPVCDKAQRVVELTGTPTSTGLMNVYPQISLLDPTNAILGKTFFSFRARYFYNPDRQGYKWVPFKESKETIYEKIGGLVFRLDAADHLDMPKHIVHVEKLPLPDDVMAAMRELEKEFLLELDGGDIEAANSAALAGKLLQMCNGYCYDENGEARPFHNVKLDALERIIDGAGDNVLCAYSYKHDWDQIKKRFPYAVHIREENAVDRWNRGEIPLLCAHRGSAGYGLDLWQGGHHIVGFGLSWSLELNQQFNARLNNPDQDTVVIHYLVAKDTVDEDVMASVDGKETTQRDLLNAMKARMKTRQLEVTHERN